MITLFFLALCLFLSCFPFVYLAYGVCASLCTNVCFSLVLLMSSLYV